MTTTTSTPKSAMLELVTDHWTRIAEVSFPHKTSRAWRRRWPHLQLPFHGLTLFDVITLDDEVCAMSVQPEYRLYMKLFHGNVSKYVTGVLKEETKRNLAECKKKCTDLTIL